MVRALGAVAAAAAAAAVVFAPVGRVSAHGALTAPAARDWYQNQGTAGAAYNNPTGDSNTQSFVCRNFDTPTPSVATVAAGGTVDLTFTATAAHVGDCAVYLSSGSQWVKIHNWPDCRSNSGTPYPVTIPSWYKAGATVLRFEWYALHVRPTIEFYAQCVDIIITRAAGAGLDPLSSDLVTMPGHLPTSASCQAQPTSCPYRDAFSNPSDTHIEGPPVASDPTGAPPGSGTPSTSGPSGSGPAPGSGTPGTCNVGAIGCTCTAGGGCDPDLSCQGGRCLSAASASAANTLASAPALSAAAAATAIAVGPALA